jgi:1-aminocyclopropane-1-carboxylate deaminase
MVAFFVPYKFYLYEKSPHLNQHLSISFPNSISVSIKREDLIHPIVSGNKFRKLKYNLIHAKAENQDTLLTFGGAYSNHIAAIEK